MIYFEQGRPEVILQFSLTVWDSLLLMFYPHPAAPHLSSSHGAHGSSHLPPLLLACRTGALYPQQSEAEQIRH